MAAASASFTLFLCLLFFTTLTYARTPVDLTAIDDANHDSFSESDKSSGVSNAIFLPSEKSESEPITEIQPETEISDSKISKPDADAEGSMESSEASDRTPITAINFRPINRHVPRLPLPVSSRLRHRCRHSHEFKPWNPRLPSRENPYGGDRNRILGHGQQDRTFDFMAGNEVRHFPIKWTRFHHVEPRFSDEPGMEISEVMKRPHRHHHHHHHHDHEQDQDQDHFREGDRVNGGLMKRIRKFLHHF